MGAAGDPVSRSVPALDGIRGLAILSVVWFHFLPGQMPGGWMGMSIFFPLSGFLVTRLLLDGIEQHHVDVLAFWERRARRLLPALWVMLAITSMLVVVHRRWGSTDTGATLSSLLGVNNWWQISHSVDYWAALRSGASPFEHLWSLSVEMQFYLVLPDVFVAVLALAKTRWRTVFFVALVAIMAVLFAFAYIRFMRPEVRA